MNDNHKKKMIAPVIVTVIFLLYLAIYLLVIMFASEVNFVPLVCGSSDRIRYRHG